MLFLMKERVQKKERKKGFLSLNSTTVFLCINIRLSTEETLSQCTTKLMVLLFGSDSINEYCLNRELEI